MVYLFLAEGFEIIEALTPVDILRRGKVEIKTVGVGSNQIKSSHGITVTTDLTIDEIRAWDDAEAVILPGGMPGTLNLEANSAVLDAVKFCAENDRIIGAICAAPSVLGHMGLLNGKNATAYPGFEKELHGAVLSENYVAADGKIVTARGMGVSLPFGLKLLELLRGPETALTVKASVQCP